MNERRLPLPTHDPFSGGELTVTRLECPTSGVVIEGEFTLGWMGRLTPEQLEFVGLLVRNRGNIQKLAAELAVAYNTARNRLDEIVAALGVPPEGAPRPSPEQGEAVERLAAGAIEFEEAPRLLRGESS